MGPELDRAQNSAAAAQRLDERLMTRTDPPDSHPAMNLTILTPALSRTEPPVTDGPERRARVTAQLGQTLVGELEPSAARAGAAGRRRRPRRAGLRPRAGGA